MEKIRAIICDVDNTIIDITHRYHLLKGKEYRSEDGFVDEETKYAEFIMTNLKGEEIPIKI